MLWVPQKGAIRVVNNIGTVGPATPGTAVPGNATTLLDGAVTELISAANNIQENWAIEFHITNTGASATAGEACMDILIGGATDDVLIAALICGYTRTLNGWTSYFFPLHIPGGVRIAATLASVRTSITAQVMCSLYGGGTSPPWRVGRKVTTYGTQGNNATGQAVVPSTSGAAASATQLTASTSEDHFAFLPGFQVETDATAQTGNLAIGIGVGAATEERIGTWFFETSAAESQAGPYPNQPAIRDVAAGSRLTMLASSNLAANDAQYGGLIYAVS